MCETIYHKAPDSNELVVRAFQKEFTLKLSETMGINPRTRSYSNIHQEFETRDKESTANTINLLMKSTLIH